jgi:hypothetical protein
MLRRYDLPSDKTHEGWAKIVIDTDCGFFAAVSDFGNYANIWTHPGSEFRKFLIGCSPDYFQGKLMVERPNKSVFDGDATRAAVVEAVKELPTDTEEEAELHASELSLLMDYPSFDTPESFDEWADCSDLGYTWEYAKYIPEPQCRQFCEKVMPRFKAMLTIELEQEAKDKEYAAEIRAARPAILAAVKEEINTLTERACCCSVESITGELHAVSVSASCPLHGGKKNG